MGWLDKLLGRSDDAAAKAKDVAGDAADKADDVRHDARDAGEVKERLPGGSEDASA